MCELEVICESVGRMVGLSLFSKRAGSNIFMLLRALVQLSFNYLLSFQHGYKFGDTAMIIKTLGSWIKILFYSEFLENELSEKLIASYRDDLDFQVNGDSLS